MATNNSVNISAAGLVRYDGAGSFSGVTTTIHDLLIGSASNGITNVAPSATSGIPVISQGSSADPIFGTAVVAGGGTGAVSLNINGAVISGTTTTSPLSAVTLTSGQILIGGTTSPAAGTLTAGTGVSIANGNNTITINSLGGGLTWTDVTGTSATMAINNGYLADNAALVTLTLPATAAQFSVIAIAGIGAGGWLIAQNANQKIIFGSKTSTTGVGGSLASTNANDCIYLIATVGGASTTWTVLNAVGNITIV
jgi:hypothetical protein